MLTGLGGCPLAQWWVESAKMLMFTVLTWQHLVIKC